MLQRSDGQNSMFRGRLILCLFRQANTESTVGETHFVFFLPGRRVLCCKYVVLMLPLKSPDLATLGSTYFFRFLKILIILDSDNCFRKVVLEPGHQ